VLAVLLREGGVRTGATRRARRVAVVTLALVTLAACSDDRDTAKAPAKDRTTTTAEPRTCTPDADPAPVRTDADVPSLGQRTFRCTIPVTPDHGGGSLLFDDDELMRGVEPAAGAKGEPCIDVLSANADLTLVVGSCSGKGLRAAAEKAGMYEVEYRVRTCVDDTEGGRTCGQPESPFVGRIVVEVSADAPASD